MTAIQLSDAGVQAKVRLRAGAMWSATGYGVTAAPSLLTPLIVGRSVEPDVLGAYFLVLIMIAVGSMAATMGLGPVALASIASSLATDNPLHARAQLDATAAVTTISSLLWGVVAAGASIPLGWLMGIQGLNMTDGALIGLIVFAAGLQGNASDALRGLHDLRGAVLVRPPMGAVLALVPISAMVFTRDRLELHDLLVGMAMGQVVAATLAATLVLKKRRRMRRPCASVSAIDLLSRSWPFLISGLLFQLTCNVDLIALSLVASPDEVAIYGIATRVALVVLVPYQMANLAILPLIADLHARRAGRDLEALLRSTANYVTAPAAIFAAAVAVRGEPMLGVAFGPFYTDAATPLTILVVAKLLGSVAAGYGTEVLSMTGRQRQQLGFSVGYALVLGILSGIAAPHGGTAVALGVALATLAYGISMVYYVRSRLGIWTHVNPRALLQKRVAE